MIRYMTYTYAHICIFSCIIYIHEITAHCHIEISICHSYLGVYLKMSCPTFHPKWIVSRVNLRLADIWDVPTSPRTKSPLALMTLQEVGWSGIVGSPCGFQDLLIQNTQQNGLTADFVATNFSLISIKSWTTRMFPCSFSKQLFNAQEMDVCHSQIPGVHWYSSHRRLKQIFEELFLELCSHAFVICCALAGEEG